jgi:Flp pilus assembly protein TadG
MARDRSGRRWRRRRGSSLIEYVVTASLYFTFVMGTVEFTWISSTRIRLANGCSKGARLAAAGSGLTAVRDAVRSGSGFSASQLANAYIYIEQNSAEDGSGSWSTATDNSDSLDPGTGTYLANAIPYGRPLRVRIVNYPYTMVTGRALSWLAGASGGQLPITTSIIVLRRE